MKYMSHISRKRLGCSLERCEGIEHAIQPFGRHRTTQRGLQGNHSLISKTKAGAATVRQGQYARPSSIGRPLDCDETPIHKSYHGLTHSLLAHLTRDRELRGSRPVDSVQHEQGAVLGLREATVLNDTILRCLTRLRGMTKTSQKSIHRVHDLRLNKEL